jgi:NADH-ubiquinone oxidoreductase chain 6
MKTLIINTLFSIFILLSSIFSITSKNPVLSVTYLIITFVLTSIYIMITNINFIGISYIIVYVGAIAVLFLFIIMMINIKISDIIDYGKEYTKTLPLGLGVIIIFLYYIYIINPYIFEKLTEQLYLIFEIFKFNLFDKLNLFDFINLNNLEIESSFKYISQIENIGFSLYVYQPILLILISLILLLAMVAAIIISSYKNKNSNI